MPTFDLQGAQIQRPQIHLTHRAGLRDTTPLTIT